jgi:phage baseplate assembly protein W|tara:strand:+ start:161 stop:616 length:456 start_codon:yes stop_codon:yes gene_type:complete
MSVRETDKNPDKFVGLTFPLDLTAFSTFEQSKTLLQQTKSNLRNLLLTTKGERVFQPDFGSDLTRLIFEQYTPDLEDRIEVAITDAIERWLPYVIVNEIIVRSDERNQNAVLVQLEYTIQTDKESLQTITFNFGQFASEEFTQEAPINKGS